MKFSKLSQLFLVSTIGLLVATLLTACQLVTIDYVFVTTSAGNTAGSAGQVETYAVDSESGALRTADPIVSSGGSSPVAMTATADYENLYVANQGNNSVVHFDVAANGVLTQKDTITTSAPPVSLAVNAAGTYLYVVTGTTSATLTEYALSSGTIGTATVQQSLVLNCTNATADASFPSDRIIPTGVLVLPNSSAVYVSAYDQSAYNPSGTVTSAANPGWVFGFAVGSNGALQAPSGKANQCSGTASVPGAYDAYKAGVKPSALTSDPVNRFVYVTDFASNQLIGYSIQGGEELSFMVDGPFRTGNQPSSVVIDPRGSFIYLSNELDNSVSGYSISLPTGTPSALVNSNSSLLYATDTQPVSITVEPALGRYVYTANHLGNSVSGFRLNPNSGVLTATQSTPYPVGANPTAILAVPHGNHAVQSVTP